MDSGNKEETLKRFRSERRAQRSGQQLREQLLAKPQPCLQVPEAPPERKTPWKYL